MARAASRSANASCVSLSVTIRVMSRSAGNDGIRHKLDGGLEVLPLIDAGAEDAELSPEQALQVDLARCRVNRDHDDRAPDLGKRSRAEHRGGGSGHLEHDVGARAARPLRHPRDLVDRARIERREAQAVDLRAALLVELDHHDVAAEVASHRRDQHADRPAADDDGLLPRRQLRAAHIVDGDGNGLDECGVVESQAVGQRHERLGGYVPQPLQRAGGVDADEVEVLADVGVSGETGRAGSIPRERHDGHAVADAPPAHALAERGDRAAHLVAEDEGGRDAGIHVAVQDVQIRAAQSRVGDGDLHLTGCRGHSGCLGDPDRAIAHITRCQHRELQKIR